MKKSLVLTAVLLAGLRRDALAQGAAPTLPGPAAELSQLAFFDGSWSCRGTAFASPWGPEHATETAVSVRSDLGGFWRSIAVDERKTKENPSPFRGHAYWGYDGAGKKLTSVFVDSFGGVAQQTSPGWVGDAMVWTGDTLAGEKMPVRDTFTKKGPGDIQHVVEISAGGGWTKVQEESCKRGTSSAR